MRKSVITKREGEAALPENDCGSGLETAMDRFELQRIAVGNA
jgi:hypothetical protein